MLRTPLAPYKFTSLHFCKEVMAKILGVVYMETKKKNLNGEQITKRRPNQKEENSLYIQKKKPGCQ